MSVFSSFGRDFFAHRVGGVLGRGDTDAEAWKREELRRLIDL